METGSGMEGRRLSTTAWVAGAVACIGWLLTLLAHTSSAEVSTRVFVTLLSLAVATTCTAATCAGCAGVIRAVRERDEDAEVRRLLAIRK